MIGKRIVSIAVSKIKAKQTTDTIIQYLYVIIGLS